jgi:hypothetical protein
MVTAYVRRAELVDPEITGARFSREQEDADKAVRDGKDDLFPCLFFKAVQHPPNRIIDAEDGVHRCIRCNWEVQRRITRANVG